MIRSVIIVLLLPAFAFAEPLSAPQIKELAPGIRKQIDALYPQLDAFYKTVHANPELAQQEEQTAGRLAKELKAAGYEVTTRIGGHGVVAILKNGPGPLVMVRADMDALPIIENTGLSYASKVKTRDAEGNEVGIMHACGHDINVACLVGTARVLASMKDRWSGTLMLLGQPAEETGAGARLMIADGLFQKFAKPDVALALHCDSRIPHGYVNYREGQMQANVDSIDITVHGKGGHGAAPHTTIDPIVLAARIVLDLQTIVSRERDPLEPVVVTVGSIHGGSKHNIIPKEVKLQLTVRTTKDDVRQRVLDSIARIAKAAAMGAKAPEPTIKVDLSHYTPALVCDPALTQKMVKMFEHVIGADKVLPRGMSLGGEDFSQFVRQGIPGFYFFLGTADPKRHAEAKAGGKPLALTHTDAYFPVPEPTIKTGVWAMTSAVLHLLGK